MRFKIYGAIIASIVFALLFTRIDSAAAQTTIELTDADFTQVQALTDPGALTSSVPASRNWLRLESAGSISVTELAPRPSDFTIGPRIKISSGGSTSTIILSDKPEFPAEDPAVVRIKIQGGGSVQRTFVAEMTGDADRDGIPDEVDECLNSPEDFDGYLDEDGCPDGNMFGIDVSDEQGSINWFEVSNDGYEFAFVKATEGTDVSDANFQTNMTQGRIAGVFTGAYHFARPDLGNDAASEAQHFLNVAGDFVSPGYLRPVLHLECGAEVNEICTGGTTLSQTDLSQWANDWIDAVEDATNAEAVLYVNSNYANNHLDNTVLFYDLWISDLTNDPDTLPDDGIWPDWDFWQYSDQGAVAGITGDVNLDIFIGEFVVFKPFIFPVRSPLDPNCDGSINIADVIIFMRYIVGQLPALQNCG